MISVMVFTPYNVKKCMQKIKKMHNIHKKMQANLSNSNV